MLALQQQQLKATRRVKSTAPWSVHSCLGRHGDSSGDPNMGPQSRNGGGGGSSALLYKPSTVTVITVSHSVVLFCCIASNDVGTKTQLRLNSKQMETIAG